MGKRQHSSEQLAKSLASGDRVALSQAITLIESTRREDRILAEKLITEIYPSTGKSVRIGITGVPGVGKSTFIESFGDLLTKENHKVAILAIDPSSTQSRGSILGDKTRMDKLAINDRAFIRPSPNSGVLGGVANSTRESILLCEAAGFDIIIIETVGVGQSEINVKNMTDFFLLLMLAGAGDELQGIKRGIMEMADLIAINKADGNNLQPAKRSQAAYKNALHLLAPHATGWQTPVVLCSAINNIGIQEIGGHISAFKKEMTDSGYWDEQRNRQRVEWFEELLNHRILQQFMLKPGIPETLAQIKEKVAQNKIAPTEATKKVINSLMNDLS